MLILQAAPRKANEAREEKEVQRILELIEELETENLGETVSDLLLLFEGDIWEQDNFSSGWMLFGIFHNFSIQQHFLFEF